MCFAGLLTYLINVKAFPKINSVAKKNITFFLKVNSSGTVQVLHLIPF